MGDNLDAFRRAIDDQPEDPLPKLVFADYLDEHGDPRGACLRWVVEHQVRPAQDTEHQTWDWWSRPPAEPNYYDNADVSSAILPTSLFRRLKGDPDDIWKGYRSYSDALFDVLKAWKQSMEEGVDPRAGSSSR